MKPQHLFLFIFILIGFKSHSQKVFYTSNPKEANYKIFISKNEYEANWIVFGLKLIIKMKLI